MEIFELRWEDWDEQENHLFTHPDKTEKEFYNDVKRLCKASGNEFLKLIKKEEGAFVGIDGYTRFVTGKLKAMGYKELNTKLFRIPGSSIITYRDIPLESANTYFQNDFLTKAAKHNEQLLK